MDLPEHTPFRALIERPALQDSLRADPSALPAAIDEILRIHAPLIANRRVATRPVKACGRHIAAGERVTLIWASAIRDEAVLGDPDAFAPTFSPRRATPRTTCSMAPEFMSVPARRLRGLNCA